VANERAVLNKIQSVSSRCVRPIFVDGDHVVIRWIFKFTWKDGTGSQIEELAYQKWNGELIQQEQFFYDPKQLVPE
jgi:hypothetical protein